MMQKIKILIRPIIKYIHTRAVILKGVAAFFYSTDFYDLSDITVCFYGVFPCRVDYIVKPCIFLLFCSIKKKLLSGTGCRSPPFFFFIKKKRREETENAK